MHNYINLLLMKAVKTLKAVTGFFPVFEQITVSKN